ncbi:MAG: RagB/SusD family nutrient uptake outer membrane protein [Bacteroidales bacterium]|nr:RagB/SusD family nutrient uptake outer membrane protein [Bacteroidales bacterium]
MKKLNKFLICFTIAVFTVISCTDKLDLAPVSQISNASFWKAETDATGGLYGMYARFRSLEQDLYYLGEMRSQTLGNGVAGNYQNELEMFYNTLTASSSMPNWKAFYTVIHDANLILKFVPDIAFASEDNRNSLLAQAHTMRALCYFVMVRTWGDLPLVDQPTLGYDVAAVQRERTSKADIFTFIKKDINDAIALFPDNSIPAGRLTFSKPAANALKGQIYLWTAKKENGGNADLTAALEALNSVKTGDIDLLTDYAKIFDYSNKGNKEVIFAVHHADVETGDLQPYNHMWLYPAYIPATIDNETKEILKGSNGYSVLEVEKHVQAQFTDDDTRKNASYRVIYSYPSGVKTYYSSIVYKYHGTLINGLRYWYDDKIVLRYGDVLLMIAEAKNGLGQDPTPEMELVRKRAYGTNYSSHVFVSGTKEQNDAAILKERLFETAFEGTYWWDLLRFGKAFELVPSLATKVGQNYLELWPIVQSTLSLEPNVKQNPGY